MSLMASPLSTAKRTVDLASGEVRVSRIRRDPPPKAKEVDPIDAKEREARMVVIGVTGFILGICLVTAMLGSSFGWSMGQYTLFL